MIYILILKSQNLYVLEKFITAIKLTKYVSIFNLPTTKKKVTLLSSPHVNKKSKEQFELIDYKRLIQIKNSNDQITLKLVNKILSKIPNNISLKIKYSK